MKKSQLRKIIKKAINEILGENTRKCDAVAQNLPESIALHMWKPCNPITIGNWTAPGAYSSHSSCNVPPGTLVWGYPGTPCTSAWTAANIFYNDMCPNGCNPGDVVKIDHQACFGNEEYCLEYMGQGNTSTIYFLHITSPLSYHDNCNECTGPGRDEPLWCCSFGGPPCFPVSTAQECDFGIAYPTQQACQAACRDRRGDNPCEDPATAGECWWCTHENNPTNQCQQVGINFNYALSNGFTLYPTQADCETNEPCGHINEEEECYKCENGYPVGNMFPMPPGCPHGWVPAASFNPKDCKKPTTPTPTHTAELQEVKKQVKNILDIMSSKNG